MTDALSFLPIFLVILACPLMMVGMGVGAWFIARAKGEKKPLSMGCMMGQCEHDEHTAKEETGLKEQVTRLEREVETLRAQTKPANGHSPVSDGRAPAQTLAKAPKGDEPRL